MRAPDSGSDMKATVSVEPLDAGNYGTKLEKDTVELTSAKDWDETVWTYGKPQEKSQRFLIRLTDEKLGCYDRVVVRISDYGQPPDRCPTIVYPESESVLDHHGWSTPIRVSAPDSGPDMKATVSLEPLDDGNYNTTLEKSTVELTSAKDWDETVWTYGAQQEKSQRFLISLTNEELGCYERVVVRIPGDPDQPPVRCPTIVYPESESVLDPHGWSTPIRVRAPDNETDTKATVSLEPLDNGEYGTELSNKGAVELTSDKDWDETVWTYGEKKKKKKKKSQRFLIRLTNEERSCYDRVLVRIPSADPPGPCPNGWPVITYPESESILDEEGATEIRIARSHPGRDLNVRLLVTSLGRDSEIAVNQPAPILVKTGDRESSWDYAYNQPGKYMISAHDNAHPECYDRVVVRTLRGRQNYRPLPPIVFLPGPEQPPGEFVHLDPIRFLGAPYLPVWDPLPPVAWLPRFKFYYADPLPGIRWLPKLLPMEPLPPIRWVPSRDGLGNQGFYLYSNQAFDLASEGAESSGLLVSLNLQNRQTLIIFGAMEETLDDFVVNVPQRVKQLLGAEADTWLVVVAGYTSEQQNPVYNFVLGKLRALHAVNRIHLELKQRLLKNKKEYVPDSYPSLILPFGEFTNNMERCGMKGKGKPAYRCIYSPWCPSHAIAPRAKGKESGLIPSIQDQNARAACFRLDPVTKIKKDHKKPFPFFKIRIQELVKSYFNQFKKMASDGVDLGNYECGNDKNYELTFSETYTFPGGNEVPVVTSGKIGLPGLDHPDGQPAQKWSKDQKSDQVCRVDYLWGLIHGFKDVRDKAFFYKWDGNARKRSAGKRNAEEFYLAKGVNPNAFVGVVVDVKKNRAHVVLRAPWGRHTGGKEELKAAFMFERPKKSEEDQYIFATEKSWGIDRKGIILQLLHCPWRCMSEIDDQKHKKEANQPITITITTTCTCCSRTGQCKKPSAKSENGGEQ